KVGHLRPLVHHVVSEKEAVRHQARDHQIEETLVILLPGVEKDEGEVAADLWNLLESVARHHSDQVGEAGTPDIFGCLPCPSRIELNCGEMSAGLTKAQRYP